MEKFVTGLVVVVTVFCFAVCLAGCSSGMVKLDKSITVDGLTCIGSSSWKEDNYKYDLGTNDIFTDPNNPNFSTVAISSWTTSLKRSAQAEFEADIESLQNADYADYSGFKITQLDLTIIDGAQCLSYQYVYEDNTTSYPRIISAAVAYITAPNCHYSIKVTGNSATGILKTILSTVRIK